jgi:hypothetical protein
LYSWEDFGIGGSVLAITGAALTGWTVGATINAYYQGKQDWNSAYAK